LLLTTQDLKKHYQMGSATVRALDGVSIAVQEGEFIALLGASGSGKSTLLNLIAGLDRPTEGALQVLGRDLAQMSRDELSVHRRLSVGIIFQSFNLISTMSAAENVALSMMFAGVPRASRESRARELSGGEQQRVAIARALANDPHLLLADEPTGNLDSHTSRDIMSVLQDLNRTRGKTVIMVTHDPALAQTYAHRTITLMDGMVVES
jgi:putative ABC transport system ATP-binding protein